MLPVTDMLPLCVKCCRMVKKGTKMVTISNQLAKIFRPSVDYDDLAFGAGILTCTFLASRAMTVENLFVLFIMLPYIVRAPL